MEINVPNGWTPKAPEFGAIALFGGGFHQAALQTSNGGHQILSKAGRVFREFGPMCPFFVLDGLLSDILKHSFTKWWNLGKFDEIFIKVYTSILVLLNWHTL